MSKILPIWQKDKVVFNNKDLPSGFRMLIVGQTGLGKTTLLLRMLIYNLDFDNLAICSPSLGYQEEYKIFINALKKGLTMDHIESIFENQEEIDNVDELIDEVSARVDKAESKHVQVYNDPDLLPEPEELVDLLQKDNSKSKLNGKEKTLMIIDDCMKKKQKTLQSYFLYGRPLGINTIYLSQAYFSVDKDTIRNNCQIIIVFQMSDTDLKNSYEQLGSSFQTLDEYKQYAKEAWAEVKDKDGRSRGYFVVDLTKTGSDRMRKNCF